MTTLLLVRHGETDWNRDGRWQGGSDTSLNDVGREQARALADELDGNISTVYSSDLARARETAEIVVANIGLPVQIDPRLRERGFGSWEGEEVLVISHGGSIRVIHALSTGVDYVRDHRLIPGVPNCSVARYVARDGKLTPLD